MGTSKEDQNQHAGLSLVIAAYVGIAIGAALGFFLATVWPATSLTYNPVNGVGLFAFFLIAAQALERFVDPISQLDIRGFGSRRLSVEAERDKSKFEVQTALTQGKPLSELQEQANAAATKAASAEEIKANTKVVMWAVASFFGMLVSGATGLYLLRVVGVEGAPAWLNVAITGLAIGAGTEPLHKLIGLVEKKAESDDEKQQ